MCNLYHMAPRLHVEQYFRALVPEGYRELDVGPFGSGAFLRPGRGGGLETVLGQWGHDPSRDQVKGELRWLEEQRLVKIEDVGNGAVLVARLTERGADVAAGRARVDGVKRPGAN